MLAGHLTNQDEDEVEDELEALRLEAAGPQALPDPVVLPSPPTARPAERVEESEPTRERAARARTETRTALPA
jgi:charged multivesicular body protein 6